MREVGFERPSDGIESTHALVPAAVKNAGARSLLLRTGSVIDSDLAISLGLLAKSGGCWRGERLSFCLPPGTQYPAFEFYWKELPGYRFVLKTIYSAVTKTQLSYVAGELAVEELRREQLERMAPILNKLEKDAKTRVFYEIWSGGIVWKDELPPSEVSVEDSSALRFLWTYRTRRILDDPSAGDLLEYWETGKRLFPNWPGFAPERLSSELKSLCEQEKAEFAKDWEELMALNKTYRPEGKRKT